MLPFKLVVFIAFLWIVGAFMGSILDQMFLATSPEGLDTLTSPQIVTLPFTGGSIEIPKPLTQFFTSFWNAATFNFEFLTEEWEILRWIVFAPLAIGIVYMLVYGLISILRGTV